MKSNNRTRLDQYSPAGIRGRGPTWRRSGADGGTTQRAARPWRRYGAGPGQRAAPVQGRGRWAGGSSGGPGGGQGGSSGAAGGSSDAADQAGLARRTRRGRRDGQAGAGRGRRCATLAEMWGSALGGGGLMERSSGGEVKG
ncbi:uncharacterized protein [Miscanthus floridulus]|uniref:uncharacterized protein n=1 Tax=Miscanthus floridulus TaxID=154761 RepID=UPI00345874DE